MVLGDGLIGQMMEPVEFSEDRDEPLQGASTPERFWATTGCARGADRPYVINSLFLDPNELEQHNYKLQAEKYREMAEKEIRFAEYGTDQDYDLLLCAYGTVARVCLTALEELEERRGFTSASSVRSLSTRTPTRQLRERALRAKHVLVTELSAGQMIEDVKLALHDKVPIHFHGRTGGNLISPEDVIREDRGRSSAKGMEHERSRIHQTRVSDRGPHPLLPGLHPRHDPPARRRGARRARRARKDRRLRPVGCAVLAYNYFNCRHRKRPRTAGHPAVATGVKRGRPDLIVFTYQGDGDLAAIGTAEILHAANRGEKFTTIFVNNAIYGMTGGQMAPTTLPAQVTTSSPTGRDVEHDGYPMKMAELLATLPGAAYVTRQAVLDVPGIKKARKALKRAFEAQIAGLGFTMVEIISACSSELAYGSGRGAAPGRRTACCRTFRWATRESATR